MKNKISLLIFDMIGLLILVALDQLTKYMAVVFLKANDSVPIFQGILELRYLENKGAAFGMLQNQKIFFIFIALLILGVIVYVLIKTPADKKYTILHVLLVLIAAGSIGNMIDRISQDYVVDFIYFVLIDFPIFNVADIYVTCAMAGLVILILFGYKEEDFAFLSVSKKMTRKPQYENTDTDKNLQYFNYINYVSYFDIWRPVI